MRFIDIRKTSKWRGKYGFKLVAQDSINLQSYFILHIILISFNLLNYFVLR